MPVVLPALLLLSSIAPTPEAPTNDGPSSKTIVVVAPKQDFPAVRDEAAQFVRSSRVAIGGKPLARWVKPICPAVIGLADALAARVEQKVRARALAIGAPVDRESCQGNLGIVFTVDGNNLVEELAKREPAVLANVPVPARKGLREGTAPVRWWYMTETRSRDGAAVQQSSGEGLPVLNHYTSSLISTQVMRILTGGIVVIDVNRAEGFSLDAVTDYAAMLALAEFGLTQGQHEGSILGLFQPGNTVRAMTERDLEFLRLIYRMPLDRQARQQRSRLIGGLVGAAQRRN